MRLLWRKKRIFFTCIKDISSFKAGIQSQKRYKYTPKEDIKTAYIDPTYSEFSSNAVYVDTETDIPVETIENKWEKLFGNKETKKS